MFKAPKSSILKNQIPLIAVKKIKNYIDFGQSVESEIFIPFMGSIQLYKPEDIEMQQMELGQGNFAFTWFRVHTVDVTLNLQTYNDRIIYNNKRYIIKSIFDYKIYGYIEYRLVSDYQNDLN